MLSFTGKSFTFIASFFAVMLFASVASAQTGWEWWTGSYTSTGPWQVVHRQISDGSWIAVITANTSGQVGLGTYTPNNQLTVNSAWGSYTYPEAFSILGTYPSMTLRSTTANNVWLMHSAANHYLYFYESDTGYGASDWGAKMWLGPAGDFSTASGISANGRITAAGDVISSGNMQANDVYINARGTWVSTFGRLGARFWTNNGCPSGSVMFNFYPGVGGSPDQQGCQWINQ